MIVKESYLSASLSAATFGPTSSKGQVWDKMEKKQANISIGWVYFVGCIRLMSLMSISGDISCWNYRADGKRTAVQIR